MRIAKGLGNAALAIAATGVTLAAAELFLALFVPESNLRTSAGLNLYVADPELGYRLESNVFRRMQWLGREVTIVTDGNGHRIPEGQAPMRRGPTLVVAGDSYVFGNEVLAEETFTWLLGSSLRLTPVNLGVGGYSLDQSARALARYLERPEADSVVHAILVVYIGNDLERGAAPSPPAVDLNGYLVGSGTAAPNVGRQLRTWITLHSRLAFFSQKAYAAVVPKEATPRDSARGLALSAGGAARRSWIYDEAGYGESSLDGHRAVFESLEARAARLRVPLTVVLLPEPAQVTGVLSDLPNRKVLAVLDEVGLPALDLLPLMRDAKAATATSSYRQAQFGHLSVEGNRVVAALLGEWLAVTTRQASVTGERL